MYGRAATRLLATLVAVCAAPSVARADGGGYVLPGFVFGPVIGSPGAFATGAELSLMTYSSHRDWDGVGAFAQLEHYGGDHADFGRWALGAQIGGPVGLELGVDHRAAYEDHAGTTGIHVAPYASMGLLTMALRLTIPVGTNGPGASYGTEGAWVIGLKLPIPWGDPPPDIRMPSGRPRVVEGGVRVAGIVRRRWGR